MSEKWQDKMRKGWTDPDQMIADMDAQHEQDVAQREAYKRLRQAGEVATASAVEKPRFVDPGYDAARDNFNRTN